jgi:pimeloyl-ACP methyl ester carboxylesterase
MKMLRCQLERMTFHYVIEGEGRPLLALHGMPLDHRSMADAIEPLFRKRRGWMRIYPDLPGMGKTRGPEWLVSQDQVLDVLAEFVERVIPGQRFCVAGLSYGGLLAQGLVQRLGERLDGLLLIVPSMGPKGKRDLPAQRVLARGKLEFASLSAAAEASFGEIAVIQTQDKLEAWKKSILPGIAVADHAFVARLEKNYEFSFDITHLPQPFMKPALFLLGRQDNVCGYRDAWRTIENYPRAAFAVLDRAGHCLGPGMEAERAYEALGQDWLDRVEEGTAGSGTSGGGACSNQAPLS